MSSRQISGLAIRWNDENSISPGNAIEKFQKGAFVASFGEVVMVRNVNQIIAAEIAGTLTLTENDDGLYVQAEIVNDDIEIPASPSFGVGFKILETEEETQESGRRIIKITRAKIRYITLED